MVVVPVDVLIDCVGELFDVVEGFAVVHLCFQVAKEVLDYGVVVAVALARHRYFALVFLDQGAPGYVPELESLIGMYDPSRFRGLGRDRFFQRCHGKCCRC